MTYQRADHRHMWGKHGRKSSERCRDLRRELIRLSFKNKKIEPVPFRLKEG